jgi:hypothetical protein
MFKNSVSIVEKEYFFFTNISWLITFSEIIAVYFESHTKPINTFCGQNGELLNVKAGVTCC